MQIIRFPSRDIECLRDGGIRYKYVALTAYDAGRTESNRFGHFIHFIFSVCGFLSASPCLYKCVYNLVFSLTLCLINCDTNLTGG